MTFSSRRKLSKSTPPFHSFSRHRYGTNKGLDSITPSFLWAWPRVALLLLQEELAKHGSKSAAAPDGRWMPDVDASYVPFTHPAKRRKMSASFVSDSSNTTKQSPGRRIEGNGSNDREDAAGFQNSPHTEGLEPQLEGVCLMHLCSSNASYSMQSHSATSALA